MWQVFVPGIGPGQWKTSSAYFAAVAAMLGYPVRLV